MSLGVAVTVDGRRQRRVGRAVFVVVVVLFAVLNVYRSATLTGAPASSHEFSHRQQLRHSPPSAADPRQGSVRHGHSPAAARSTPHAEVDQLLLVRSVREEDFPAYNVTVDTGEVRAVPLWQRRLSRRHPNSSANAALEDDIVGPYYFLTELLQVRIYSEDEARFTVRELKQWLHYMLLAGVEHFYVCDHYAAESERLDGALSRYIAAGLVTYIPWGHRSAGRTPLTAQTRCYRRLVTLYRRRHRWQIAVDVDEYPFSPNDTRENFIARYLDQVPDDVSEISLPNYLMLGEGNRTRAKMAIERIIRMTSSPANKLVKPIYRPDRLRAINVHRNPMERGRRVDSSPDELRMLHYWGTRGQQQDPGAARKMMSRTVEMTSMRDAWSQRIENSLLVFGERDAFSNVTGP